MATDIPSDFLVQIGEANFHLHKVAICFSFLRFEFHDFLCFMLRDQKLFIYAVEFCVYLSSSPFAVKVSLGI